MATIDIGAAASDRESSSPPGFTYLDLANPATDSGTITSIAVYVAVGVTTFTVGIFSLVSGTTYVCRSAASLGNLDTGLQTINDLSLAVEEDDVIGGYWLSGSVDRDNAGGSIVYAAGDKCTEDLETDFSSSGIRIISVHGTGTTGTLLKVNMNAQMQNLSGGM